MKPCYRGNDECPDDCCLFAAPPAPRVAVLGDFMLPHAVHDQHGTWTVYGRYPTNWGFKLDTIWPCEQAWGHQ